MWSRISEYCVECLIKNNIVEECEKNVYRYGIELICSFLAFIISSLLLGTCWGYVDHLIIFLCFFIPIRIVGGGYHASSYRNCFVLSHVITIAGVIISNGLFDCQNFFVKILMYGSFFYSIYHIWNNVERDFPSKSLQRIAKRQTDIKIVLYIYCIVIILNKLTGREQYMYTAIVAVCLSGFLIRPKKKGEENNG